MVTRTRPLLRLITRLNIGGPARQALLLTKDLRDAYSTTLAAGTPQQGEGEMHDPEVDVMRVPLVRPLRPAADISAVRAVRSLLRSTGAEILHTHMAKAGTVGRVAATGLARRPRTVHTFHGHVLDGYFSPLVERTFVQAERWLARRTDVLIAVSVEIRDQLLDLGIGRADQYRVIPLGFDLTDFLTRDLPVSPLRAELGLTSDTPLIGVLGRLAPIKDHDTLLRAMTLLPDVHLAVLGDGELRDRLEEASRAAGLGGRVHFVGWRTDVADAIAGMDVVVLTSRNEGSPVSLIEALASARPVVATDVGGVRSVVREGVSGFLVPSGDAEAIASKIRLLVDDREMRERMGRDGRRDVAERYSKERLVADIRDLYGTLIGVAQ